MYIRIFPCIDIGHDVALVKVYILDFNELHIAYTWSGLLKYKYLKLILINYHL